jgi:hypothetical protein
MIKVTLLVTDPPGAPIVTWTTAKILNSPTGPRVSKL